MSDVWAEGIVVVNADDFRADCPPPVVSGGGWYAGVADRAEGVGFGLSLCTNLQVPSTDPPSSDGYYVLLSCFDSAGSYDQIGMSAWAGNWWLLWSWTTHDIWGNLFYHYDAMALSLMSGWWYTFAMVAEGNGYVRFELWTHGYRDWYSRKLTGGTVFPLAYTILLGIYLYVDFTLYEEVYWTQQPTPPYDFLFHQTWVDSNLWSYWCTFKTGTGWLVAVTWNANDVFVDNPNG
jgi:hypothetical protein